MVGVRKCVTFPPTSLFTQLLPKRQKNILRLVRTGKTITAVKSRTRTKKSHDFLTFQVLDLMKEVAEDEEDSSDISGYHSDSDSAIMMSGNSPYVSKRARYNFLSRSGK